MRIAVLIYGRLNKCAEHYKNIVESIGLQNDIDFFLSSDNSSESLLNEFIHIYKPISYTNSPIKYDYDLGKYPGKRVETHIHNMTCHFINKNRVFVLLEEYIKKDAVEYDCVMSLRVDSVFENVFDFTHLADNTIYIPFGWDPYPNSINDQIAYGKVDVMKKYNSIDAHNLLEDGWSIPHPESLTLANIRFYKLQIQRVNIVWHLDK